MRGSPRFARVKWAHPSQEIQLLSMSSCCGFWCCPKSWWNKTTCRISSYYYNSVWDFLSNVEHCIPMKNHIIAEMPDISEGNVSNAGPSSRKEWQSDWTTMAPKNMLKFWSCHKHPLLQKEHCKKNIQFGMCLLIHDSVKNVQQSWPCWPCWHGFVSYVPFLAVLLRMDQAYQKIYVSGALT